MADASAQPQPRRRLPWTAPGLDRAASGHARGGDAAGRRGRRHRGPEGTLRVLERGRPEDRRDRPPRARLPSGRPLRLLLPDKVSALPSPTAAAGEGDARRARSARRRCSSNPNNLEAPGSASTAAPLQRREGGARGRRDRLPRRDGAQRGRTRSFASSRWRSRRPRMRCSSRTANAVIEYVNPAFEATTGYSRSEAVGRTGRASEVGEAEPELLRAAVEERSWPGRRPSATPRQRKRSGELFRGRADHHADEERKRGSITHFVSVMRDVTEPR